MSEKKTERYACVFGGRFYKIHDKGRWISAEETRDRLNALTSENERLRDLLYSVKEVYGSDSRLWKLVAEAPKENSDA